MTVKKTMKTIGLFAKDVLEVVSPVVVTGLFLTKPSVYKPIVKYSDVMVAINNSGMWSNDKVKVISVLPMDQNSDFYKAVIEVIDSTMWSNDKVETIVNMCKKVES